MQLYKIFASDKCAVWKTLNKLRFVIEKKEVWRPTDDIQFVFLCGANIQPEVPSRRRKILLDFSLKNLQHTKFFLAESIFNILKAEGHKENFLDIENDLSEFADYVIVILESESAFCELGAFAAHQKLREKLIVINDIKHKNKQSFINYGPIEAIKEQSKGKNILFYEMQEEGRCYGDGIGKVFPALFDILYKEPSSRRKRITECNPNEYFTKDSLRFIHDIVYFTSPIALAELSTVIKILFSKSSKKHIQKHLGLLCAIEQINRNEDGFYNSIHNKPFFEYGTFDRHEMIASFKTMYYRYDFSRLKCT